MIKHMNNFKYFLAQSKYNLKNAHALSKSFWIGVVSMILNNLTFFIIWALFMQATGPINGWTTIDVFGMIGVSMVAYGITHGFFFGIHDLPQSVVKGTFDNVLLSPANIFLKLGGSSFSVTAYGDLIQGTVVAVAYGILMHFDLLSWALFVIAIALGCVIFMCFKLLCALIVFFIHDGEVVSDQLFEIFLRPGLYPGAIFPSKMKFFFMTVIPALLTSAVPIDVVKGSSWRLVSLGALITLIWVCVTVIIFRKAVRRYESGNYLR